jgi:hypothetical protein
MHIWGLIAKCYSAPALPRLDLVTVRPVTAKTRHASGEARLAVGTERVIETRPESRLTDILLLLLVTLPLVE